MHLVISPSLLILMVALEFFFESFVSFFGREKRKEG